MKVIVFFIVIATTLSCKPRSDSSLKHTFGHTRVEPSGPLETCTVHKSDNELVNKINVYLSDVMQYIMKKNPNTFYGVYAPEYFCISLESNNIDNILSSLDEVGGANAQASDRSIMVTLSLPLGLVNDAELAALISHELAHITMQHFVDVEDYINHKQITETDRKLIEDNIKKMTQISLKYESMFPKELEDSYRKQEEKRMNLRKSMNLSVIQSSNFEFKKFDIYSLYLNAYEIRNFLRGYCCEESDEIMLSSSFIDSGLSKSQWYSDMLEVYINIPYIRDGDETYKPLDISCSTTEKTIANYINNISSNFETLQKETKHLFTGKLINQLEEYQKVSQEISRNEMLESKKHRAIRNDPEMKETTKKLLAMENKYSNFNEEEADDVGYEFYIRSGFNPVYFTSFLKNAMLNKKYLEHSAWVITSLEECKKQLEKMRLDQTYNDKVRGKESHPSDCWRIYNIEDYETRKHAKDYAPFLKQAKTMTIFEGRLKQLQQELKKYVNN